MTDYNVTKSPTEIVASVDEVLLKAWSALDKPRELYELSRSILELPTLLNGLGYYLAMAESDMDKAKDVMEYEEKKAVEEELKVKGVAVNRATIKVSISDKQRKLVEDFFERKREYRVLKNKYDSTSKSFEGMRSRLSVIKKDVELA